MTRTPPLPPPPPPPPPPSFLSLLLPPSSPPLRQDRSGSVLDAASLLHTDLLAVAIRPGEASDEARHRGTHKGHRCQEGVRI